MRPLLTVALALSLTMGAHSAAQAQARSHLGPQIGYNFDYEALVLGAQYSAPIGPALELYPSFNYFLVDVGSAWAANLDLKYHVPGQGIDWLYVGGGLNVARVKVGSASDTRAGANLIAGVESRRGRVHPFGEFRLTAGRRTTTQLVAGLNFTLSSH